MPMIYKIQLFLLLGFFIILTYSTNHLKSIRSLSFLTHIGAFLMSLALLERPRFQYPSLPEVTGIFQEVLPEVLVMPHFSFLQPIVVDSLSIVFILLTTFIFALVSLAAQNINYRVKELYLLLIILEILIINSFVVIDLFSFYIIFEILLIPMFMLIGIWGSHKKKTIAANQLFLYTFVGSFFLLIGILILFLLFGTTNIYFVKSFIIDEFLERILFCLFFIGFSVKIPMFPFHTWLPKAHVEAPAVGSVLLAGILLKIGSFAMIRYCLFLFPSASFFFTPAILTLAGISILFSSLSTLRQIDLKKIIAYSSIAHMNFMVGGIFSGFLSLSGSLLLQIAHGLSSSALFLCVGFLYDRYRTRNIFYLRGLVATSPIFTFFFIFFNLANLGFPGTLNFAAELLLFLGIFQHFPSLAIISLSGIFLSAIYSFLLFSRISFGIFSSFVRYYSDITRREFFILIPFLVLLLLFGFKTSFLTNYWSHDLLKQLIFKN